MKQETYFIKNNLPEGIIKPTGKFTADNAIHHFMGLVSFFMNNGYYTSHSLRNDGIKPIRGTIEVCVDGFYYYVELIAQ
jgi:hypothetical protein